MPLTLAGQTLIATALVGADFVPFNNTNTFIGVGDSTLPFNQSQTDLQSIMNTYYQPVDASFPIIDSNVITFQATFPTSVANYTWNEWGIFNAGSEGLMLNRKQESLGTKTNNQSFQLTIVLTVIAE